MRDLQHLILLWIAPEQPKSAISAILSSATAGQLPPGEESIEVDRLWHRQEACFARLCPLFLFFTVRVPVDVDHH